MGIARARALAAATALLAGAAGGCAQAPAAGTPTASAVVGTCKDVTTADEMIALSDTSPAVPCDRAHTLEVYALATAVPAVARLGPVRPGPELLTATSSRVCPVSAIRPYLGAGDLDSQWGVSVFVKFPTRAEWAGGSRRVVCDLVVAAASPTRAPVVTRSLRGIMAHPDSARVRLCRRGEDDAVLLTCDRPHTGERVGDVTAAGSAAARARACTALAVRYTGAALRAGWRAVVTDAPGGAGECWVEHPAAPTRGTVRAGLVPR